MIRIPRDSREPISPCAAPGGRRVLRGSVLALVLALGAVPGLRGDEAGAAPLAFGEFFRVEGSEIRPSERLRSLAGHRVKVVGFMVKMEVPPLGGFYLAPRPVTCDEGGGGTADLPPEAVYVVVRSAPGREIPYSPRSLEVSGELQVGYHLEADQRVTHIRILLDQPQDLLGTAPRP